MFKPNRDPVLFDSNALELADMTVLHYQGVLEKTDKTAEARKLEGLRVTDREIASVALEVLNGMKAGAQTEYARQLAVNAVQDALRS